jgi:hypothetical protein
MKYRFLLAFLLCCFCLRLSAQQEAEKNEPINDWVQDTELEYEIIYDEPDSLNKLWVIFYPLYGELFASNTSFGYAGQLLYMHKKKWTFSLQARKAYSPRFDLALANGRERSTVDNRLGNYHLFELGATYHLRDDTRMGTAKITPHKKNLSERSRWASVPTHLKVPAQVRSIVGLRGGAYFWGTSFNASTIAEERGHRFVSASGDSLPASEQAYTTMASQGFFLGSSWTQIRNIFIRPNDYEASNNDHIFSLYADILVAPFVQIAPIEKNGQVYPADFRGHRLGFRLGAQGLFNRAFGWAYKLETGYRPALAQRGFYAQAQIGIAIGSRLRVRRDAYLAH